MEWIYKNIIAEIVQGHLIYIKMKVNYHIYMIKEGLFSMPCCTVLCCKITLTVGISIRLSRIAANSNANDCDIFICSIFKFIYSWVPRVTQLQLC